MMDPSPSGPAVCVVRVDDASRIQGESVEGSNGNVSIITWTAHRGAFRRTSPSPLVPISTTP